jgi:hypothetical protein
MSCCVNDCCGPGSYCCSNASPHTHDEQGGAVFPPLKEAESLSHSEIYFRVACVAEEQGRFNLAKIYLARALAELR